MGDDHWPRIVAHSTSNCQIGESDLCQFQNLFGEIKRLLKRELLTVASFEND